MKQTLRNIGPIGLIGIIAATALAAAALPYGGSVSAQSPVPGPQSDSVGVEGRIPSPPPTQAASVTTPGNGQTFNRTPIQVAGTCPEDTIVKIFSNGIFVGSTECVNGRYTLEISLFSGLNDIVARVFDALDQPGPDSLVIQVTYNDPQFATFGNQVLITSQYARRAADPGKELEWPIIISGGTGPFAISVDWGDGTPPDLKSQAFPGLLTLKHTYKDAGTYRVIFKVVDKNGSTSFMQVIAVANGAAANGKSDKVVKETVVTRTRILWEPAGALLLLALLSFWLGRRYELAALRKRLEREYR